MQGDLAQTRRNNIVTAKAFASKDGVRLACVDFDDKDEKCDLVVYDQNCTIKHRQTIGSGTVTMASFCHTPHTREMLFFLKKREEMLLYAMDKNAPYTLRYVCKLPQETIKRMCANSHWAIVMTVNRNNSMSLFWVDLTSQDRIYRVTTSVNLMAQHVTIRSDDSEGTLCFVVEKVGKTFHLSWMFPRQDPRLERQKLPLDFLGVQTKIIFLETFGNRLLIVAQDTLNRKDIADIRVMVFQVNYTNMTFDCVSKFILRDFHAPLGISLDQDGILLLAKNDTMGWIDITRNGDSDYLDQYLQVDEKNAFRYSVLSTEKGQKRAASWVPSCDEKNMELVIFSSDGFGAVRVGSSFEITRAPDNFLEVPKIYSHEKDVFAVATNGIFNYVRHMHIDI